MNELQNAIKVTDQQLKFIEYHKKYPIWTNDVITKLETFIKQMEKEDLEDIHQLDITDHGDTITIDLNTISEIFIDGNRFMMNHPFFDKYSYITIHKKTRLFQVKFYSEYKPNWDYYLEDQGKIYVLHKATHEELEGYFQFYFPYEAILYSSRDIQLDNQKLLIKDYLRNN